MYNWPVEEPILVYADLGVLPFSKNRVYRPPGIITNEISDYSVMDCLVTRDSHSVWTAYRWDHTNHVP